MVKGAECHLCHMGFIGRTELNGHYRREHPRSWALRKPGKKPISRKTRR